ncbi:hypothetical protein N9Y48_00230 [Zobellia sp.]|nr:hypothetical protein [Zobellia sp.]
MGKCKNKYRLDLKTAIILEDARRIISGVEPINNLRKLAFELSKKHLTDIDSDSDELHKLLWRANKKGICPNQVKVVDAKKLVSALCELLNTDRDTIMIEEPYRY